MLRTYTLPTVENYKIKTYFFKSSATFINIYDYLWFGVLNGI